MNDTHDRAERALRDALAGAPDPGFAPLDPDALRAAAATGGPDLRRRRWLPLAAAAAMVVLAVPVAGQLLGRGAPGTGTAGLPAAAPAPRDEGAGPKADAPEGAGPAAPPEGFRYASMADVVVLVPASWGYDRALGPDWCADGGGRERLPSDPGSPFVDVRPEGRAVRAIACPGDVPAARQTMHLTWRHADAESFDAAPVVVDGWRRVSRAVGSVVLTVVAPEDQGELADRVLASARQVSVDHLGCPTSAPVSPASPGATPPGPGGVVGVDAVASGAVLCQYDDLTRAGANLVGSRALDAGGATDLLRAMAAGGPVVGRPPGQCLQDDRGATLVVVQPVDAGGQVWLRVPGCDPATVSDGGLTVSASTAVCSAVFVPPLALPDGGQADDACLAAHPGRSAPPKR